MALIHAEMRLCDIVLNEPTLVPVINRFGIGLGVGDKSVAALCREQGLDTDFFLTILNTFVYESYFPEKRLKSFCVGQIIDYLTKTNSYYERFQLPNIERHFNSLIEKSDNDNNDLEAMRKFFLEFKKGLLARIEEDKNRWFPAIRAFYAETPEGRLGGDEKIVHREYEPDLLEEKLNDLLNLFVKHLSGEYDRNLCYAVFFAVYSLEKDIRQHNRIRNRVLLPSAQLIPNFPARP